MVREKAIERLKWFKEYNEEDYCGGDRIQDEHGDWYYRITEQDFEAFDMAIKALEQKPCEDAISCEAVINWLKAKDIIKLSSQEDTARKELKALFSVTPKIEPRKGHWICDGKGRSFADYHCSECGLKLALCGQDIKQRQDSGYSLFCGGCGADMREVVEE